MNVQIVGTMPWYWCCRRFFSPEEAKINFHGLQEEGEKFEGRLGIGVYRHGLDAAEANYITCVSHESFGIDFATNYLGGEDEDLHPELIRRLVVRRAKVIVDLMGDNAPSGVYRIVHPPGGERINEMGEMEQP